MADDDFNPYDHRDRPEETKTKTWQTIMNFLKGNVGTGILAMHMAFKNSGILVGIVSTIFFSAISCYTMQLLIRAQYLLCKKKRVGLLTYSESMEYAFETGPAKTKKLSKTAFYTVDIFLLIYQVGSCSVYIMFISNNLQQVIVHFTGFHMPLRAYCCLVFIPILFMNMIRTYRYLAPFATIANVCTMLGLCFIMYFVSTDFPSFSGKPLTAPIARYPMHVGTVLFALNAIGVITSLENNMLKPGDYIKPCGVLNWGFFIIMWLYMLVGLFGFVKYGDRADMGSVITLDIPVDDPFASCVKIMFCLAIVVSHAVQCFPAVEILLTKYLKKQMDKSSRPVCFEYIVRLATTFVTLLAAISIPMLGEFINLLGAFCLSALCFIFPPIVDIYARYPDKLGGGKWRAVIDILIMLFGLFSLLVGTYACICDIIVEFAKSNQ